jgi:hypothetical protein
MTNETQTTTPAEESFTQQEVKDFKRYYASAVAGILAGIPFGVTVDPNQLAAITRNVAVSMVNAQRDVMPEELHEDEKSNFPHKHLTKEDISRVLSALIVQDRGLAAEVLSAFGVASIDKLDAADYTAAYALAFSKLAK